MERKRYANRASKLGSKLLCYPHPTCTGCAASVFEAMGGNLGAAVMLLTARSLAKCALHMGGKKKCAADKESFWVRVGRGKELRY